MLVKIKRGMMPYKESQIRAWEQEHVGDFRNGIPEIEQAGNRAESAIRGRAPFSSKEKCEQQSSTEVLAAIAPVVRSIYGRSKLRDKGSHTWYGR
jgi:hypothetical protein